MLADQTDGKTDIHLPIRLVDKVTLALDLCLAEMQVLHYRASSDAARQIEQAYRFGNPVLADARRRAKSVRESAGFYDKPYVAIDDRALRVSMPAKLADDLILALSQCLDQIKTLDPDPPIVRSQTIQMGEYALARFRQQLRLIETGEHALYLDDVENTEGEEEGVAEEVERNAEENAEKGRPAST